MPSEFPTLTTLLAELRQLESAGRFDRSDSIEVKGGGRFSFEKGRDVGRLTWPGVGRFLLDRRQQLVVATLIDAYLETAVPEVSERYLLRVAGSTATRLAQLFDDGHHPAWGLLVVGGTKTASYRIAAPKGGRGGLDAEDEWSND